MPATNRLDPQIARELGIDAANSLEEALGTFHADDTCERVTEREIGR